jgi:hypothetical protein
MHSQTLRPVAAALASLLLASASPAAPPAEIDVQGNGQSIPDGDTTPSVSDGTDFGPVAISATHENTFSILNTGQEDLVLTGGPDYVQITGANAGDFTVTAQPTAGTVPGVSSTTFTVQFSPSASGLRVASIVIPNNDGDEGSYTFSIQGTGDGAPEIDVRGNGSSIPDGDTTPSASDDTEFGSTVVGAPVDHVFTIENAGTGPLTLGSVTVTDTTNFSVSAQPASPVAASASTTFTIRFDPASEGLKSATVDIPNDDADESPYSFAIQGTGLAAPPTVESPSAADVEDTTATLGGDITSLGGETGASERGVYWSATQGFTPPGQGTKVLDESPGPYIAEPFSVPVTSPGLPAGSLVYFRAFATNSNGQGFSDEQPFQTEPDLQPTGLGFSGMTSSSMTISWTPESGDGSIVVVRQGGLPTADPVDFTHHGAVANPWNGGEDLGGGNYVVHRGSGSSVTVEGLAAVQTYGVAVYAYAGSGATSPDGINYQQTAPLTGSDTTPPGLPSLSAPEISGFATATSADLGATIDSDGGASITSHGTVADTSPGPDLSNSFVEDSASPPGSIPPGWPFSHTHTGLPAGKLIYFAGYATNSTGTGYSTPDPEFPTQGTFYTEPAPATLPVITGETYTSFDLSWTPGGDGDAYDGALVAVRRGAAIVDAPVDGTTYVADSTWRYGTALGTDTYVVYQGPLTSVTVTGLSHDSTYYLNIYEYSGVGPQINYLVSPVASQSVTLPRASSHLAAYTIQGCSDCHAHNRHTSFAPQGTEQEALCKTCHVAGGMAENKADVGLHHGNTDCTDCHEVHDTGEDLDNPAGVLWTTDWRDDTTAENQNWIRGNVDLYMPEPKKSLVAAATPVIWHDGSAAEMADPAGSETNPAGKLDGLCQACHTNPNATTQYHTNDPIDPSIRPTDPIFGYTHPANACFGTAGQRCLDCHQHAAGFGAVIPEPDCLASGCHAEVKSPWRRISESSPGVGDGDFGTNMTAHHVNDGTGNDIVDRWDCIACHAEAEAVSGCITAYHGNGTVDLRNADEAVTAYTDGNAVYVGWTSLAPEARSDFCLSCHDADGATVLAARPSDPGDPAHATPLNPFNDGVTNHHEPDGFDGTPAPHPRYRPSNQAGSPEPGVVDVKSQFDPINVSHHAVLGPAYGAGATPATPAPGGNLAGAVFGTDAHGNAITWESTLNCEDCHVDTDREGVDVGLSGHGSLNARYMLKNASGLDASGDFATLTLNCFGCHNPRLPGGTGILSNYPEHVGQDGNHMVDADNLYGIACLNCHGGGYPDQYLDGRGDPQAYLPDGIPFGAIHGVPSAAQTPNSHTPNTFTYGSALGNVTDWTDLGSPSCGAIEPVTVMSNCNNHSGGGTSDDQSYTRSYSRSYRAP